MEKKIKKLRRENKKIKKELKKKKNLNKNEETRKVFLAFGLYICKLFSKKKEM